MSESEAMAFWLESSAVGAAVRTQAPPRAHLPPVADDNLRRTSTLSSDAHRIADLGKHRIMRHVTARSRRMSPRDGQRKWLTLFMRKC